MSNQSVVPESHHDLANQPGTAIFTTLGPSGEPQSTAIWFVHEDGVFRTSLHTTRQKYRNLVADERATLFLIDPANPMHTIEARGTVELTPDPDAVFFDQILTHYGADPAQFPAPRTDRVVLTLTPDKVNTVG